MLRGVRLRGGETGRSRTRRWSSAKWRPTTIAELASSLDFGAATQTGRTKCRPALSAESCAFTVLRLATRTLHALSPPRPLARTGPRDYLFPAVGTVRNRA